MLLFSLVFDAAEVRRRQACQGPAPSDHREGLSGSYVCIYIYIYMCIHIYIYIERSIDMCIYIYVRYVSNIYIYIYILHIYIYIMYIYVIHIYIYIYYNRWEHV